MIFLHPSSSENTRIAAYFHATKQELALLASSPQVHTFYSQFEKTLEKFYRKGVGWIETDLYQIGEALLFAARKHQHQVRKDEAETSFIIHPLTVTHQLMVVGKVRDPNILMASLLHDTLEDTSTTYEELLQRFGGCVADFVQEVTDDKNLSSEERKHLQVVTAPTKSAGAAQIKLADKWDNLQDLLYHPPLSWSSQRVEAYFSWATQVIQSLPWVNAPLLKAVKDIIDLFTRRNLVRRRDLG